MTQFTYIHDLHNHINHTISLQAYLRRMGDENVSSDIGPF